MCNDNLKLTVNDAYTENQIEILEGLEAVRKRPGMYIGSTEERGLHHLIYEIVDNSIDEAMAGFCKNISIELLPNDYVNIMDDGRGIPVGKHPKAKISTLEVVFTMLHAGGKFGGNGYKVAGGLHGVGASVVNALSELMEVNVYDGHFKHNMIFSRGKIIKNLNSIESLHRSGTHINFKADSKIFSNISFNYKLLAEKLREKAFLNAGLSINLIDKRDEENINSDIFKYDGGIKSFVEFLNEHKVKIHDNIIHISHIDQDCIIELAIQYTEEYSSIIYSFANNISTTEGGSHETGFKVGMTKVMNDYSRKFKFLKENEKNFIGEDIREGITAVINVKLVDAQFEGQTKTKLGNNFIKIIVENMINNKLMSYLEENPLISKKIVTKIYESYNSRIAAKKAKEIVRKKTILENTALPGKLADCQERDPNKTELYIVEGDSAGGSAKSGRDRKFQAILALWGKMLNVEKASIDRIYTNEKLSPMVTAIGAGFGSQFDIKKIRYGKIILMADADVDGSHIRTLILTFFFKFMRPLLENGNIYIAQPPLYKIFKNKTIYYAYSEDEKNKILETYNESFNIQRYKGLGEMNPEQLWETTLNPINRTLLQVTMNDVIKAAEMFNILMGEKVEPRKLFIESNAKYVKNLDI